MGFGVPQEVAFSPVDLNRLGVAGRLAWGYGVFLGKRGLPSSKRAPGCPRCRLVRTVCCWPPALVTGRCCCGIRPAAAFFKEACSAAVAVLQFCLRVGGLLVG